MRSLDLFVSKNETYEEVVDLFASKNLTCEEVHGPLRIKERDM
jgi:hypothetical protein